MPRRASSTTSTCSGASGPRDPAGRTTVGGGKALTGTASRWNEPSGLATTCLLLKPLFDRLYVLRNQLHHGGSTQAGSLNRRQVEAGAAVMARLIPTFIGVIIDNPDADWGRPYFPPVFDA